MHIEDEQIQRILHGELRAPAREEVHRHLTGCAQCRFRLAEAEREEQWIFDLLRRTDHTAPAVDPEILAAIGDVNRAEKRARVRAVAAPSWGIAIVRGGWLQWAAGVALAVAVAGAAYTAPGSPVPAWVDRVAEWMRSPAPQAPSPVTPGKPETETPSPPVTAGIAVAPRDRFTIRFAGWQSRGLARVALTNESNISARALNAAATFTTGANRLTIDNSGSTADYEIDLPHDAPWVEILVGERRLFLKEGQRLVTGAPTDAEGCYLVSLSPPGL
jgi:hypothetical protein